MIKSKRFFVMLILAVLLCTNFSFADRSDIKNIKMIDKDTYFVELSSFDALVREYAKSNNMSIESSRQYLSLNFDSSIKSNGAVQYGYFTKRITITPTQDNQYPYYYHPTVKVYCKYTKDPYYYILDIIAKEDCLQRRDGNIIKQFRGSVWCYLEDHKTIEFQLDGQFFDRGSTYTIGISNGYVNFGVSSATGLYADVEEYGRIILR